MKCKKINEKDISELKNKLEYNHYTGIFIWKDNYSWKAKKGVPAGTITKKGHRIIHCKRNIYQAHRLAWLFYYSEQTDLLIDHIDGNKDNNAVNNLRLSNNAQNLQNQKKAQSTNKVGLLGVCANKSGKKNPYRAEITLDGKRFHLGHYPTAEEAHQAYLIKKREIHPFNTI